MPVTIEDKVELFSKMIFGNIEAQSSEQRQELLDSYEAELLKLKKEIEGKRVELLKNADAKAEKERIRLLAQLKSQEQRRITETKQKVINKIMTMLYGYAAKLSTAEDYKAVLNKAVEGVSRDFSSSKLVYFYVLQNETEMFKQVLLENINKFNPEFKYVIEAAPLNILGGLIAKDKENLLEIDLTLRTLVEEYRDTVGAAITRKYNEVSSK